MFCVPRERKENFVCRLLYHFIQSWNKNAHITQFIFQGRKSTSNNVSDRSCLHFLFLAFFFFFLFFSFLFLGLHLWHMDVPRQGVQIGAAAAGLYPQPQQCQIWAMSATSITAHRNTRSLTYWARPGIKPTSSWILVSFINTEPQQKLLIFWGDAFFFFF